MRLADSRRVAVHELAGSSTGLETRQMRMVRLAAKLG